MTDVTGKSRSFAIEEAFLTLCLAIWNTNAFFAYVFSVKIFGLKWESRKLGAVVLATLGVLAVVYGGSTVSSPSDTVEEAVPSFPKSTGPLIGDILTLIASVGYAGYQVYYKKHVSPSFVPEFAEDYRPLSASEGDPESDTLHATSHLNESEQSIKGIETVFPPPFGLYSNFWTSAIGACTFAVLWIPLPILHWLGIETFSLPQNLTTVGAIAGIALTGSLFNAGFMVRTLHMYGSGTNLHGSKTDNTRVVGSYYHVCRRIADNCSCLLFGYHARGNRVFDHMGCSRLCYHRRRIWYTCL